MPMTVGSRHVAIEHLAAHEGQHVLLKGWLYNARGSKHLRFLLLRDGTGLVQCVVSQEDVDGDTWHTAEEITRECSLEVTGTVVADARQVGGVEIGVSSLRLIGASPDYPIAPKEHGVGFLMSRRHLWLRGRLPWAILRIRNRVIMAIHAFFQERGFLQMDAPILTGNAVEGTSTLFAIDYFGEQAYLTQSGQLYGEAMAMAFGCIYTFGPTFRAEKSKTRRHLTEFWMMEPEMAFYDLDQTLDLAEDLLVYVVGDVLARCGTELAVLERDTAPLERVRKPFPRMAYSDAVDLLRSDETARMLDARVAALEGERATLEGEREENAKRYGQARKPEKRRLDARGILIHQRLEEIGEALRNLPAWKASARNFEWGADFGGSDETVLTWHYDRPLMIHRYPEGVKAFYMKRDPEDERLALGMDVLAPEGYGEIIGGGERATDLRFLEGRIEEHGLPREVFEWYLDLRRFGSVPHAGFGLGLERTLTWITGIDHVREAIPFPRLMGRLEP